MTKHSSTDDIAIVGMSGRFPGAAGVAELWAALRAGRSGIAALTEDELRAAGVAEELIADPAYVRAAAALDGIDLFDADFFGVGPKEAQILDPQQRLFLEHSWAALEDAGCDPTRFDGAIGVFGGAAWSTYLTSNLVPAGTVAALGELAVGLANDKDSLTTRVAHTLGLSGPAYGVQSYCSTSLVAVCAAASSLAAFESDLALAGGVVVSVPHRVGYLYQPGGIAPPDGQCRVFDAAGLGSPLGSGVGVVALRRLGDALAAGDRVYAVLRGWAVNNDAGHKVGFTAPGVRGQAEVVAEALASAGLTPADIDYVEAHGTGTALGDAAELAALQEVFAGESLRVGSVKPNLGHLDRAAGVTNLIKAALALHHEEIPPTRAPDEPNAQLRVGEARLEVVTELSGWARRPDRPRRAGVSAFGIGGTNAHVVLEEAPPPAAREVSARPEVLVWSARTDTAADAMTRRLADYLAVADTPLADVAFTLQTGRQVFGRRRMVVARSAAEAAALLARGAVLARAESRGDRLAGFLVTGAGEWPPGLAVDLYRTEPVFRTEFDRCRTLLGELNGDDPLANVPAPRPVRFAMDYALAKLVWSWGVEPAVVAGSGPGEYVAACLAGVLSVESALALVAAGTQPPEIPHLPGDLLTDPELAVVTIGPGEVAHELAVATVPAGDRRPGSTVLAEVAGRLWLAGVHLDWAAYQQGRPLTKVGLPGYPFERARYWIDPPAAQRPPGASVELLAPKWTVEDLGEPAPLPRCVLLTNGPTELATALAARLGADTVVTGPNDPVGPDDLPGAVALIDLRLLDEAGASSTCREGAPRDAHRPEGAPRGTGDGEVVRAVLPVVRTLGEWGGDATRGTRIVVATRGAAVVTGAERPVPMQAAATVLPLVANQEYLNLDCRAVDLDPSANLSDVVEALAAEVARPEGPPLVAYRDGRRHVRGFAPVEPAAGQVVRPGGSYLVTGGLGDVGLLVAEHLARAGAARLVLTSRGGNTAGRREAVQRLRDLGAEVLTPAVDVTDLEAMRAVLAEAGDLDGVIHAAADTAMETFRPLRDVDEPTLRRQFGAKVGGALVLRRLLDELPAGRAPGFCLLFSSTSALLGGVTFGGYAAANAALTAIAHRAAGSATRWLAASWDTWSVTLDRLAGGFGAAMTAHAMTADDALAAFDALVVGARPDTVVAAGGLHDRLPTAGETAAEPEPVGARFARPELPQPYRPPRTPTERALAELWSAVLGIEPVGTRDNFFDLGGTSLVGLQMLALAKKKFGIAVPTVALFEGPTVHALAAILDTHAGGDKSGDGTVAAPTRSAPAVAAARNEQPVPVTPAAAVPRAPQNLPPDDHRIAVIGMAGRFPGAGDVETFWRNLREGVESISFFSPEELAEAGVPTEQINNPSYVPARPVLDDVAGFDAGFFGMSPRMAALTDPQQRVFLEVCWEALEQAGYAEPEHRDRVGVFAGSNISTYLLRMSEHLLGPDSEVSHYEVVMGNDKDALTTTVSYLFDLHGPSVSVQTFCSTSLVATHLAVRSLRAGECELALAGGVSIRVPDRIGHVYGPGGMESPDGHVRTFDAQARGSMFGDGAAVVVLKRLADALRDGDHIWSVIRGSAMNNDGALKVGYTAPSVVGQARVIADALADAGVTGEDISYVEAHGTATELGDPIEVAALTRAFGPGLAARSCPIGSVKTNVGHLDRAAGASGLIKTSLALTDRAIPASLHFTSPNPEIDFESGPFYVNTALSSWPAGRPRIAGINSLGMGGTNVHTVVEEAPPRQAPAPGDPATTRRYHVLPVSARTAPAAEESRRRLGHHLAAHPELRLPDVAHTLQVGRRTFEHRRVLVTADLATAATALTEEPAADVLGRVDAMRGRSVAFLFAGVGEQYPGLVTELYRREPIFREVLDDCLRMLGEPDLAGLLAGGRSAGPDLAVLLGRATGGDQERTAALERTSVLQPALFAVEYALARTLMAWGVRPAAMLGYSLGEYVAACLAGVLSLPDALALVTRRAELIDTLPPGAMLAVSLSAEELDARFGLDERELDLAAVNGPGVVVVAGEPARIHQLTEDLRRAEVVCRELSTTHAFHSGMLAPVAGELTEWVRANVRLHPPQLPYVSNVTGQEATEDLVCDPAYWARHMCATVRFAEGAATLLADEELAVLEIGPGPSLGALLRGTGCPPARWPLILNTLPGANDPTPDDAALTTAVARLWLCGVDIDWPAYHGDAPGRVPLPTYPFQRQRYWMDPPKRPTGRPAIEAGDDLFAAIASMDRLPEERWLYLPAWRQTPTPAPDPEQPSSWLVFTGDDAVTERLRHAGAALTVVRPGDGYAETGPGEYTVAPGSVADLVALLRALRADGREPDRVVHLWSLGDHEAVDGLHTLVALARATGETGLTRWALDIVVSGTQEVLPGEVTRPEVATLLGPTLVLKLEYPAVATRLVDVPAEYAPDQVVAELLTRANEPVVALRRGRRWTPAYEPMTVPSTVDTTSVRDGGVYLITGGLGGIALGLATELARTRNVKLVLLARNGLPAGEDDTDPTTRRRVAAVTALLDLGAEVEIVVGDVADPADAQRAVDTALDRFGALHGVLHAAGVPGIGLMQFKRPDEVDRVLAPKVAGTLALARALRIGTPEEVALDFLVLFSSITSATGGGPGQVDYCAANAYLDAYAQQLAATGRRVLAVDWGEWTWNAWEEGLEGYDGAVRTFFREHRARTGIDFAAGWRSLLRALSTGEPRVVVSPTDFPAMVAGSALFTIDAVLAPALSGTDGERHPRPDLVTAYQEPSGAAEKSIAEIWRDALRIDRIGVLDNFFELGGNSLLGVSIVAAMRREFEFADLPPHVLYEAPTVAALASNVEVLRTGGPAANGDASGSHVRAQLRRSGLTASAARRRPRQPTEPDEKEQS